MNNEEASIEPEEIRKKAAKINLAFEQMIIRCAVGCLINNIHMSDNDYVRMHLAFSRLSKKQ